MIKNKIAPALVATVLLFSGRNPSFAALDIMPCPAEVRFPAPEARLPLDADFVVAVTGITDARLRSATNRLYHSLVTRTGIVFTAVAPGLPSLGTDVKKAGLLLDVRSPAPAIPTLDEDESYALVITDRQATLSAPTTTGALRGLQTFLQLVRQDAHGYYLPAVTIRDMPRFSWRGLMIDVSRRWQPLGEIKRVIDGMELVKLNVLHLHLTDDQGFRIESKTHPELHMLGSDGLFFTQDQMREIIAYAAERAIRVVPEFDLPGHATAWGVSHPELLSGPPSSTYAIEREWGIFDPAMDPANPAVYELLSDFFGEMAALFPDACVHVGGDENNGKQWNANSRIQKFITDNGLKDNRGLHAHFSIRLSEILARNNKVLLGWDEILHPDLPASAVVHSWRGPKGVAEAVSSGHRVILSHGYYIDLSEPASSHYLNDPIPPGSKLTPGQQKLVLGGEATMWSEWTSSETIDSRIWPRTAAIAERLWSPQAVRDVADMYRRLAIVSLRLDEAGMRHEKNRTSLLRRLAGDAFAPTGPELTALRTFSDACEPVKQYARGRLQLKSWFNPLGGFADATVPDSASARDFNNAVAALLTGDGQADRKAAIVGLRKQLQTWHDAAHIVATALAAQSPRLQDAGKMAEGFIKSIRIAEEALAALETGRSNPAGWKKQSIETVDAVTKPNAAAVDLPAVKGIMQLVEAAP